MAPRCGSAFFLCVNLLLCNLACQVEALGTISLSGKKPLTPLGNGSSVKAVPSKAHSFNAKHAKKRLTPLGNGSSVNALPLKAHSLKAKHSKKPLTPLGNGSSVNALPLKAHSLKAKHSKKPLTPLGNGSSENSVPSRAHSSIANSAKRGYAAQKMQKTQTQNHTVEVGPKVVERPQQEVAALEVGVKPLQEGWQVRALLSAIFAIGLFCVALEDVLAINKSAVTLVVASVMWIILAFGVRKMGSERAQVVFTEDIGDDLREVGGVILFLLPAMAIVETIDHFGGFQVVNRVILAGMGGYRWRLMPIVAFLTFFLSAVLDNLTATIVALKILKHTVPDDKKWRHSCGGLVVLASNAGGVWSPIGDVTTTMLWISGRISAVKTVCHLFIPSFVAVALPLAGMLMTDVTGKEEAREAKVRASAPQTTFQTLFVLIFGLSCILSAPLLKVFLELPPYMGMIFGLGVLWIITDCLGLKGAHSENKLSHSDHEEGSGPWSAGVVEALRNVDQTGIFFFTGILFAVGALDSGGVLKSYSMLLMDIFGSTPLPLCYFLGISSAIVDNVPLVQAAIDMYKDVPEDDPFWQLTAVAAGVGGSLLSIGSAAGVMLMGMEGVEFGWYLKNVTPWAAVGFFFSIWAYEWQRQVFGF